TLLQTASGKLISRYVYGPNGPISMNTPTAGYYLTGDALGSVTGVIAANGTRLLRYTYEPFGLSRPATKLAKTGLPSAEPLRYAGQFFDTFGLYDLRAREYDPGTGRFTSQDPLTPALTDPHVANYVYTADNPLARIDPSGQSWLESAIHNIGWLSGYAAPFDSIAGAGGVVGLAAGLFEGYSNCNGQLDTAIECGFAIGDTALAGVALAAAVAGAEISLPLIAAGSVLALLFPGTAD